MDLGKVKELASDVKYYIGNPSAWEHYDDFISEKIRAIVSEIEALAELEKTSEDDVKDVAERILNDCDGTRDTLSLCANYLQQYAESYHAKKCAEQWIDIAERLPEKFDEYVCISMKDACPVHRPYVAVYRTMDNSWTKLNGATCFPSHWQPLPEAPRA